MRIGYNVLLVYLLTILHCALCFGQEIRPFERLELTSDFPNLFINTIEQDSRGLLWIGTNNGFCLLLSEENFIRYDTNTPNTTLKSNLIQKILPDSKGRLWIGTRYGGLTLFDPIRSTWKTFSTESNSLTHNDVWSLIEDARGNIWIGTERGLNCYVDETEEMIKYPFDSSHAEGLINSAILSIFITNENNFLIGTWGQGIFSIERDSEDKFSIEPVPVINSSGHQESVWSIFEDSKNNIWIGTHYSGIYLMREKNDSPGSYDFINYPSSPNEFETPITNIYIADIQEDRNGHIWFAGSEGLSELEDSEVSKLDVDSNSNLKFIRHSYNPINEKSIISNVVRAIEITENGLIWFGSDQGLTKYNRNNTKLQSYIVNDYRYDYVSIANISSQNEDIVLLRYKTKELICYDMKTNELLNVEKVYPFIGKISRCHFMKTMSEKELVLITERHLIRVDFEVQRTSKFPLPAALHSLEEVVVRDAHIDKYGRYWIGTSFGLFLLSDKAELLKVFDVNDEIGPISDMSITNICQCNKNEIWISTFQGLNHAHLQEDNDIKFTRILRDPNKDNSLLNNRLLSMICLNDKIIFGSYGGVFTYNLDSKLFYDLGISNASILTLLKDGDNSFWAASQSNIFQYNTISNKSFSYKSQSIGLLPNSVSTQTEGENIFFGGVNGFSKLNPSVNPKKSHFNQIIPVNAEVTYQDTTVLYNFLSTDEVSFRYNHNNIKINFTSTNWQGEHEDKYVYRLIGLFDNWVNLSDPSILKLTKLNHGEYTLQIKQFGADDNNLSAIKLYVQAPFWRKNWFYLILVSVVLGATILISNLYTKEVIEKNKRLENEIQFRKEIESELQNINSKLQQSNKSLQDFAYVASHDLKEPLRTIGSYTSLLNYKYKDSLDDTGSEYFEFISSGVNRMQSVISSLLTYSNLNEQKFVIQKYDSNEILKETILDLESIIKQRKVNINQSKLPILKCDKTQVRIIFNNIILNAIKFNKSRFPTIVITSEEVDSGHIVSFADNGIGIENESEEIIFTMFKRVHNRSEFEGNGIGLSYCKNIMDKLDGRIWYEKNHPNGTIFNLYFPK